MVKNKHSKQYFFKAQKYLIGGVNSPVRSFNGVGGNPIVMKYGRGTTMYDYDNNAYTDYCLSWGSLILGHANRNACLAAKKMSERGSSFGTTTREEIDIAEFIVEAVPSIDRIRFVNSGTEATMSAIRLARGFTKKNILIKFDGCYHGHVDDLLLQAGSGVAKLNASSSEGIPQEHVKNTLSLPYNDIKTFQSIVEKHGDDIAAVIIEPVAGNMGVIASDVKFLKSLRELTVKHSIVLIFDEIMSGFRTNIACVQEDYGVIPDMTCLGKIIGGGFPIGAYGGRKDIMEHLAPLGGVYQAGTFSGNPVVMKVGLSVLRQLNDKVYHKLNQKSEEFASQINEAFTKDGIDARMSAYKGMMSLRFRSDVVKNYDDAKEAMGNKRYEALFKHLLTKGIYIPPADLEAFFISTLHTTKDLNHLKAEILSYFHNELNKERKIS